MCVCVSPVCIFMGGGAAGFVGEKVEQSFFFRAKTFLVKVMLYIHVYI